MCMIGVCIVLLLLIMLVISCGVYDMFEIGVWNENCDMVGDLWFIRVIVVWRVLFGGSFLIFCESLVLMLLIEIWVCGV